MSLEQCKSPKARRITFAWGNQERFRKSGSHRDRGWRENALWGDGAGWAEAWRRGGKKVIGGTKQYSVTFA